MKIIILQDYLRSGGTERQCILLARAFANKGHETTLLTHRPNGALASTLEGSSVSHVALQHLDLHLDWFAPGLLRTVNRLNPDVVITMGRMANCLASIIQDRFPRLKVVSTMRTGKPLPFLFRRSLKRVSHIVANSHQAKENLMAHYQVPAAKISIIHNSLVFPFQSESTERKQPASPVTLLNVAMFRPEKNQRELIEICSALPASIDWRLVLGGEGPELEACRLLVAKKNLAGKIHFAGFVSDPTTLYQNADIAVLTSKSESLSNFLIEAQAHGLPCVAYDATGVGECFKCDESGYLVMTDDRATFSEKLITLIGNAEIRKRFGFAAKEYAQKAFDPNKQAQAYLDLFAQLIG